MIKALVSVDMDLASGLALRYAYQLANLVKMELRTIHVEKPDAQENVPSTGWVRDKWEKALKQKEQEDIANLLNTTKLNSPSAWSKPIITMGDRPKEIAAQLENGLYDLFIEGSLATFNVAKFYEIIDSYLYQNLPGPVVMVKNMTEIFKMLLLVDESVNLNKLISTFVKVFGQAEIDIDLIYYKARESADMAIVEDESAAVVLRTAQEILESHGRTPNKKEAIQGTSEQVSRYINNYGLVLSSVRRPVGRGTPLMELMGRLLCPIFLCWQ